MIINFRGMQNFNPHYPSFAYAICRVLFTIASCAKELLGLKY